MRRELPHLQPDANPEPAMALLRMGSDIAHPPSRTAEFRPAWTGRLDLNRRAELRSFFTRLDRESRCRRFGHAAADELLCLHADKALQDTWSTVGVFIDRTLRGVLELYPYAPAPILEDAIVVEQGWRRRGLGSALLRAGLGSLAARASTASA